MKKDEPTPGTPSAAYMTMYSRWSIIDALLGGTETMRAAGETLLPRHTEESDAAWRNRLELAVLFNATELTLDMLAGKPFSDPVKLGEETSPEIAELAENVDLMGNNLDVFARSWFRDGMCHGHSHVMVEMPRLDPDQERTREDDNREGIRPYLVLVPGSDVLFMSGSVVDGKEVVDHVRILEEDLIRDGWGEKIERRIRILEPGTVQIWRFVEDNRKGEEWTLEEEWETGLDYVPFVTFYTERQGVGVSKPPLLDLAYLNVRHWQLDADLTNIISVSCFPMLAMSGVEVDGASGTPMVLGPNKILGTPAPDGKIYYVEHTGAAISTGIAKLDSIERAMASYGAQFLQEKPGDLKATVRALDSAESLSQLQAMTLSFRDALTTVLGMASDWIGEEPSAVVDMDVDFGLHDPNDEGLNAVETARKSRDISRKAFLNELKRRRYLAEDYDIEDDEKQIKDEAENDVASGGAVLDIDPAQSDDPEKIADA